MVVDELSPTPGASSVPLRGGYPAARSRGSVRQRPSVARLADSGSGRLPERQSASGARGLALDVRRDRLRLWRLCESAPLSNLSVGVRLDAGLSARGPVCPGSAIRDERAQRVRACGCAALAARRVHDGGGRDRLVLERHLAAGHLAGAALYAVAYRLDGRRCSGAQPRPGAGVLHGRPAARLRGARSIDAGLLRCGDGGRVAVDSWAGARMLAPFARVVRGVPHRNRALRRCCFDSRTAARSHREHRLRPHRPVRSAGASRVGRIRVGAGLPRARVDCAASIHRRSGVDGPPRRVTRPRTGHAERVALAAVLLCGRRRRGRALGEPAGPSLGRRTGGDCAAARALWRRARTATTDCGRPGAVVRGARHCSCCNR